MPITNIVFILILIFVLIPLLEVGLSAFWLPSYMRLGIPLLRRRVQVLTKEQFWQAAWQLANSELPGFWYPTVVFKQISPNELAFRHKLWELRFRFRTPIRGTVRLSDEAYTVTVTNYLPWSTPGVLLVSLWLFNFFNRSEFNSGNGLGLLAFLLLIVAITCGLQLVVFRQINNRILEQIVDKSYSES